MNVYIGKGKKVHELYAPIPKGLRASYYTWTWCGISGRSRKTEDQVTCKVCPKRKKEVGVGT